MKLLTGLETTVTHYQYVSRMLAATQHNRRLTTHAHAQQQHPPHLASLQSCTLSLLPGASARGVAEQPATLTGATPHSCWHVSQSPAAAGAASSIHVFSPCSCASKRASSYFKYTRQRTSIVRYTTYMYVNILNRITLL